MGLSLIISTGLLLAVPKPLLPAGLFPQGLGPWADLHTGLFITLLKPFHITQLALSLVFSWSKVVFWQIFYSAFFLPFLENDSPVTPEFLTSHLYKFQFTDCEEVEHDRWFSGFVP